MALPVIGAALRTSDLPHHRDWLLEKQRDLELQSFQSASVLLGDWRPLAEETLRHLDGYTGRLGLHGPYEGLDLDNKDPELRPIISKRLLSALEVCEVLGADQMVLHSPFSSWNGHNLDCRPGSREAKLARIRDVLDPVVGRAEQLGVVLVLENIEDVDPMERRHLAEGLASPSVRLSIDTGHAEYAHGSTGAPPVDVFVRKAGEMLDHVHLQDADGYADRHWQIGEGTIHWQAVFRAIAALPQRPRLLLELAEPSDIPASMAYLEAAGLGQ